MARQKRSIATARVATLALAMMVAAACQAGCHTDASAQVTRDSAGIRIIENARPEGPGEFTGLSGVEPWPGDSVVAWNTSTWVISVFDAKGVFRSPGTRGLSRGASC